MKPIGPLWRLGAPPVGGPRLAGCALLLGLLGLLGLAGCGTVGAPLGGAKDRQGPRVLGVRPATESVRLRPERIEFTFDEYLKSQDLEKGVFISPPPPGRRPQIYLAGKRLIVRLDAPALEARTYVITLGQGLKDFNEGNPLAQTLQYAFTPAEVLDTNTLSGRVRHPLTREPAIGFLIALFDADSVARRGLAGLKPIMASQTDSLGYFQISYLRPGPYVLFGFKDKDNSFSWNAGGEAVAQYADSIVRIRAGEPTPRVALEWFADDTLPPRPRGVEALNRRSLKLELSEPVTAGRVVVGADSFSIRPDAEHLFATARGDVLQLFLSRPVADSFAVQLMGLTDTVGNVQRRDSTLKVRLRAGSKPKRRLEIAPLGERPNPYEVALGLSAPVSADSAQRHIVLIDSGRTIVPGMGIRSVGGQLLLSLPTDLNPDITYRVVVDTLLQSIDSLRPAQRQRFTVKAPPADKFGAFTLTVRTTRADALIVLTNTDGGARRYLRGTRHELPYLPPGTYTVSVIEDADGNGRWTPGRAQPPRRSERVYRYPNQIVIRGGWSQELKLDYPDPEAEPDELD